MNDALENFRFHEAAHVVYHFFWGDFCDWYIEWIKPALADADREQRWRHGAISSQSSTRRCACCIRSCRSSPKSSGIACRSARTRARLRSIISRIRPLAGGCRSRGTGGPLQEIIVAARNVRAEMKIDPKRRVAADISSPDATVRATLEGNTEVIQRLATLSDLRISGRRASSSDGSVRAPPDFDLRISHGETLDVPAELARLRKERERLRTRHRDQAKAPLGRSDISQPRAGQDRSQMEGHTGGAPRRTRKVIDRLAQLEKIFGDT